MALRTISDDFERLSKLLGRGASRHAVMRPMAPMKRRVLFALMLVVAQRSVRAQAGTPEGPPSKPDHPAWTSRLFYGGGLGLSFGSVESVYIAPLVGYHVVPRFDVGVQPFYLYANNKVYTESVKTNDYGADLLARVRLFRGVFVEGRYEWISHEYVLPDLSTARRSDSLWLLGVGYAIGKGPVGAYVSALYDLSYDGNDPYRPYDQPWILQVGVGVNF